MAFIRFPCNFFSIFFCTTFNVLSLYLFMANENKFKIYSLQERVKFSCMSEHFRRSVPECVLQNIMLRIKSWSSVIYMYIHCILGLYFPCIGEMVNKCKTLWEGKTSIILWECEIFWFFKWQDRSQSIFFFNVRARLLKFRLPFIELTNQGFKTFSASCKKLRLGLRDSFVGKWRLCNC